MLSYGIVDTHVHLWSEEDLACPLSPAFGKYCRPIEYKKACGKIKVDKYVFMEVARNEDNYLLECESVAKMAKDDPKLKAFVIWAPISSDGDNVARILENLCNKYPLIRGVRQAFFSDIRGTSFIDRKFVEGLLRLPEFGLCFALGSCFSQNESVMKLLEMVDCRVDMVMDHLGKPPMKENLFEDWKKDINKFSKFPNLYMKISSVATEASNLHWLYEDVAKYIKYAIEAFGWDKVIYGSDFPVSCLNSNITLQFETIIRVLKEMYAKEEDMYKFFVSNAEKFFRI